MWLTRAVTIFVANSSTTIAIEVAIYRMGNGPGAKIPEKWERTWKMALRLKWPKNGRRNGKNGQNQPKIPFLGPFFHFGGHFSAISGMGPFSIIFMELDITYKYPVLTLYGYGKILTEGISLIF